MRLGRQASNTHPDSIQSVGREIKSRRLFVRDRQSFLGSLGINSGKELRRAYVSPFSELSNSQMVGNRLSQLTYVPHSNRQINRDQSSYILNELEEESKAELAKFFENLPAGTIIGVAAQKDKTLTVEHTDSGEQDTLSWEAHAEGNLWTYAEKPDNSEAFVVGESNCRLEVAEDCELVLADDTKQVRLTFTQASGHMNHADTPDYLLQVSLPKEYEEVHVVSQEALRY